MLWSLTLVCLAVVAEPTEVPNARLAAEARHPTAQQARLLRVFHGELIAMTPGQGQFPANPIVGELLVAKYEVPQNLWEAVVGQNPSRWKGPRNSVEMINYEEAIEFCRIATGQLRALELIDSAHEVRLPTESEWEYFASAGTDSTYSFGDDASQLGNYAWYTGNAAGNDPPVGAKAANPWGLYDVHGYLWEWCTVDLKMANTGDTKADPKGVPLAVLRGGSWKDGAAQLATKFRRVAPRDLRDDAVGFRCVVAPLVPNVVERD